MNHFQSPGTQLILSRGFFMFLFTVSLTFYIKLENLLVTK